MKTISKLFVLLMWIMLAGGCGKAADNEFYLLRETGGVTECGPVAETEREEPPRAEVQPEPVVIYICGEVNTPGVYILEAGSRICDALELAGGLTEAASPDYWNLAELLTDGQMLCFPTREEARERSRAAGETTGTGRTDARVNINTATLEQLTGLPGIGETRAKAILAYRKEHGSFLRKEDLMQVSGIGKAVYENLKDEITVD